jgi:hypothetical protein
MQRNQFSLCQVVGRWPAWIASAAVLALIFGAAAGAASAGEWQGKEITKDGVVHVMNPATPASELTKVTPAVLWEASGEEEDYIFGVLNQIACAADGTVYLLDAQLNVVYVFSPDGEFLREIGREGEGPGEFRRPVDLFLTPDGNVAVLQRMPGKIVVLTPDGEPVGDHPLPRPEDGGMQMLSGGELAGDHVVLSVMQFARKESGFDIMASLIAVDSEGKQIAEYRNERESNDFANMVMDEKKMQGALVWQAARDGRVYVSDNFDAYTVQVWRPDGTLDKVIEREYQPRKRSKEEMERNAPRVMIRSGNRTQRPEVVASETDRDIQQIFCRDNGAVWVMSSKGGFDAPDDIIGTFDIYDAQGRFTNQIVVEGKGNYSEDGFHVVGDRLYVVTGLTSARRAMFGSHDEGEEEVEEGEPMGVICYDMSPIVQSEK